MCRPTSRRAVVRFLGLLTAVSASPIHAGEGHDRTLYSKIWEWTAPRRPRAQRIPHTMHRAGHPNVVGPHAAGPKPGSIVGYRVGGGLPFGKGEVATPSDGTWGWDSVGNVPFPRSVKLGFGRGRKHQGGTGAYATDRESSGAHRNPGGH